MIAETITTSSVPYFNDLQATEAGWFLGGIQVWQRASAGDTNGAIGLIEQVVPPGLGSPWHVHANEDEEFYILEGQSRFFCGGESRVVGPGGYVFLPRGVPHGFRTEGDVPCRSLLFATPGGFEQFVAELSTATPPAGPPDMAALVATAARYGVEILGPLPE